MAAIPTRCKLSNPNRSKSIMNKHEMKFWRNFDAKTGNREPHQKLSAETVSNELLGGVIFLRIQPYESAKRGAQFAPIRIPTICFLYNSVPNLMFISSMRVQSDKTKLLAVMVCRSEKRFLIVTGKIGHIFRLLWRSTQSTTQSNQYYHY